jgi:hypothetical protein
MVCVALETEMSEQVILLLFKLPQQTAIFYQYSIALDASACNLFLCSLLACQPARIAAICAEKHSMEHSFIQRHEICTSRVNLKCLRVKWWKSLFLIKHYDKKKYGGVEVYLLPFLISILDGDGLSGSH